MERREKIDAGAYVYFTFLRPFAELAGVELDWTVPRDSLDLYPFLELIDGALPRPVERGDARDVLPADPVTMPEPPADERAHAPGPATWWWEAWHLDAATRRRHRARRAARVLPERSGVAWCWTLSRAARSRRARSSCATTRSRCRAQGLEVRADGLWGELGARRRSSTGRTGSRRSACASTTRPTRSRGEIGERIPVGLDLEWEVDGPMPRRRATAWPVAGYVAARHRARRGAARPRALRARRASVRTTAPGATATGSTRARGRCVQRAGSRAARRRDAERRVDGCVRRRGRDSCARSRARVAKATPARRVS